MPEAVHEQILSSNTPSKIIPLLDNPHDVLHMLCCDRDSPQRAVLEALVRRVFARCHGADVRDFHPLLLGFAGTLGLRAVVGVRDAAHGRGFFAEQYLDQPVEQLLAHAGIACARTAIAEVGNLALEDSGQARWLIAAMTAFLHAAGYRQVLFTATAPLTNAFHRMGLSPVRLATADPARLKAGGANWGRYYALRPQVCVGDIAAGYNRLAPRVAHGSIAVQRVWRAALGCGAAIRVDRNGKLTRPSRAHCA